MRKIVMLLIMSAVLSVSQDQQRPKPRLSKDPLSAEQVEVYRNGESQSGIAEAGSPEQKNGGDESPPLITLRNLRLAGMHLIPYFVAARFFEEHRANHKGDAGNNHGIPQTSANIAG